MPLGAGQSSVWTGSKAYLFSGFAGTSGITDRIVEWQPDGSSSILSARLPQQMRGPKAVWTGSEAYMAGGWVPPNDGRTGIMRFDPATRTVTTVAELPVEVDVNAVIWHDGTMYIVGGDAVAGPIDDIYAYTPGKGVRLVGHLETGPIEWGAYAEVGGKLYLLGGDDWAGGRGHPLDTIIEFDPATLEAKVMRTRLPLAMTDVSTASDGKYIYVIGGRSGWKPGQVWRSSIDIYDPVLDVMFHSCASLPEPLSNAAVFARGPGDLLVVGGVTDGITPSDKAYTFRWSLAELDSEALLDFAGEALDCVAKPLLANDLDVCDVRMAVKDILPAGMLDTIPLGQAGSLTVHSKTGGRVHADVGVCNDLFELSPDVPALAQPPNQAIYLSLGSEADMPEDGKVRVELDYANLLSEGTKPEDVQLHYHDGEQWVELGIPAGLPRPDAALPSEGTVESGIDTDRNVVWAVVDRIGTFAMVSGSGGSGPTVPPSKEAPWPVPPIAFLLLGLSAFFVQRRGLKRP